MISIWIILWIILVHWVADFVFQTHEQSINKSKSWKYLIEHTLTYSTIWYVLSMLLWPAGHIMSWYVLNSIYFTSITFVCHTITDYFTSRLNSKLWIKGDTHNFFVSIGFDQVLHYIQLFLTYLLLR